MSEPKYPQVSVKLVGEDGNAFAILGRVSQALRDAHVAQEEVAKFHAEATSGNYDHLLQTVMQWVNVDPDEDEEDPEEDWDWEDEQEEENCWEEEEDVAGAS